MTTIVENLPLWDGQRRGFYEVWYATWNDPRTGDGFWLRYLIKAPGLGVDEPHAQVWFARQCARDPARSFGLHRRYPISALVTSRDPFAVTVGPSRLHHDRAVGSVSGAGHAAEWDLRWTPSVAELHLLPEIMYRGGGAGESSVTSPNSDIALSGVITVDGERLELSAAPGAQSHTWGTKHAAQWAWGHCNAFDNRPGAVLEVLSPRLVRRGLKLPPMTVAYLRLPGEDVRLTRFDQALLSGGADVGTGRFRFRAGGLLVKLEGEFSCAAADVIRARYVDPDGEERWNHFSALGDLRVSLSRRVRGRWVVTETLTAPRRAAFELCGPVPDAAVTCEHVAIA